MSAPTISINFNLDSESADFQKIVMEDITDWTAEGYTEADMRGYFVITFPDGTQRVGSTGTPDIDWSAPTVEFKQAMAAVIGAGVQVGMYSIVYNAFVVGAPATLITATKTFNFQPYDGVFDCVTGQVKSPDYEIEVDCFDLIIRGNNTTDFGYSAGVTGSSISHQTTLHYPDISGTADLVVASVSISSAFTWVFAAYEFTFDSLVTYFLDGASEPDLTVTIRVKQSVPYVVKCDVDLCATIDCYSRFVTYITDQASAYGSMYALPSTMLGDFIRANALFQLVVQNQRCGNYTEAADQVLELEAILKKYISNCSCACKNTGKPKQITPPTALALVTVNHTYPVVTTFAAGVLTIGLDAAFLALVASLTNAVLQSTDESIGMSSSLSGITRTWTLLGVQYLAFKVRIQYTAFPITYTVSQLSKRGKNWNAGTPVIANAAAANLAALRALMAQFFVTGFTAAAAATPLAEKVFVDSIEIKPRSGATATEPAQVCLEVFDHSARVALRLIDVVDGLPVSMSRFIDDIEYMDFNLLFIK